MDDIHAMVNSQFQGEASASSRVTALTGQCVRANDRLVRRNLSGSAMKLAAANRQTTGDGASRGHGKRNPDRTGTDQS
jgi:hypothetical protein